jgi:ankyrin repeat protein
MNAKFLISNEQILKCPISKKYFLEPVTLNDGNNYEKDEIIFLVLASQKSHFTNIISPITQKELTFDLKNLKVNSAFQQIINDFINLNIIDKKSQYKKEITDEKIELLKCPLSKKIFKNPIIIKNKIYEKNEFFIMIHNKYQSNYNSGCVDDAIDYYFKHIYNYPDIYSNNIDLSDKDNINNYHNIDYFKQDMFSSFYNNMEKKRFQNLKNKNFDENKFNIFDLLQKLIEEYTNLNLLPKEEIYNFNFPLVSYIYNIMSDPEDNNNLIKDIISSNGINKIFNYEKNEYLIHLICKYSNLEVLKYVIDKNIDLNVKNIDGNKPIHYICKYARFEMLKYIVEKGIKIDLNEINDNGESCLHLAFKHSSLELIEFIINNGFNLNLNLPNKFKFTPINILHNRKDSKTLNIDYNFVNFIKNSLSI